MKLLHLNRNFVFALVVILISGCNNNDTPALISCNTIVGEVCPNNTDAEYCLIGIKWGETPEFVNNGPDANGPEISSGVVTYSFHTIARIIRIHNDDNLQTISIDDKGTCVRDEIRDALSEFERIAQLEFVELADNSDSDIEFLASTNESLSVGYCNYLGTPCDELMGKVVFSQRDVSNSCDRFYQLALHEIGHSLGLGHVTSLNVMNVRSSNFDFDSLQAGDIAGIRSIYGQ